MTSNIETTTGTMTTTRDITVAECPWLTETVPTGTVVYPFYGPTYGCVTPSGTPVTLEPGDGPFWELPTDALG